MQDLAKYRILIVDDDEDLREVMYSIFVSQGFTVFQADNGVTALDMILKSKIDVVVSDIRMPGGDGLTLLQNVRGHDPKLPIVIFVTGFADISISDCIRIGAQQVFQKPFNQKELVDSVKQSLSVPTD